MAVYNSNGSGGVHMDKAISGKKATDPKKAAPVDPKKAPAKKAAPGKALPPFMQPKKKGGK